MVGGKYWHPEKMQSYKSFLSRSPSVHRTRESGWVIIIFFHVLFEVVIRTPLKPGTSSPFLRAVETPALLSREKPKNPK
jgi:hypothetical protein